MSTNDYVREKLFVALSSMATSEQSLKARLENAYVSALIRLKPEDFPKDDQDDFRALQNAMMVVPDEHRGSARASIEEMTDEEVKKWIDKICSFVFDI